jgi:FeS assembly SUF system protein
VSELTPTRTAWTPDGEVPVADRPPADGAHGAGSGADMGTEPRPSEDALIEAIATVYDPEIPVNIYELGLIYTVEITDEGAVQVEMTLTAPACPSAQELPEQVQQAVLAVPGVTSCHVETVWDPPWDPSRMTEEARLQLNMF